MQKNNRLYLRCNIDELIVWKEQAIKQHLSLSGYARICLNKGPNLSKIVKIDPLLLRQIAAIGNNLNQIARRVNMYLDAKDCFLLVQVLDAIKLDLEKILLIMEGYNADKNISNR